MSRAVGKPRLIAWRYETDGDSTQQIDFVTEYAIKKPFKLRIRSVVANGAAVLVNWIYESVTNPQLAQVVAQVPNTVIPDEADTIAAFQAIWLPPLPKYYFLQGVPLGGLGDVTITFDLWELDNADERIESWY